MQPVFVLVRPQLGENIGKAARAMLNFGLTELRLVAPRDGWPNPSAGPAASGADIILEKAQVFDSVADAVADCAHVYATTVRKRGLVKPVVTPEVAAQEMHAADGRVAILFGPERSGLETDDVTIARTIVTVPINPEFGSLNLAQAVQVLAYECRIAALGDKPAAGDVPAIGFKGDLASAEQVEGMFRHLEQALIEIEFLDPDNPRKLMPRLRRMFSRTQLETEEVNILRGIATQLIERRQKIRKG